MCHEVEERHFPYECCYKDEKLSKVELCDGIKMLDPFVFHVCSSLETLVLPSALEFVNYHAIDNCPMLTTIQCNAVTPPDTNWQPFDESLYAQASLLVPEQSLEDYKSAEHWEDFFSIGVITAGVDGVQAGRPTRKGRVYDIGGRQLNNVPTHGLYIKGGKVWAK